jgi:hypothetical protein
LTFAGVVKRLKCDLAKRHLEDKALSISEIAWLLGYQDVSAFTNAFQRWTGTEVGTSQTRIWHGAGGDWLRSTNLGTPLGGGAVRSHLAATEACQRDLAATGADLSAYNSTESAADFADLRKVLGIDVWNVYATSYGSYVAQTLMRDHPEGIGHKVRCGSILADATVRFAPIVDMA